MVLQYTVCDIDLHYTNFSYTLFSNIFLFFYSYVYII